MNFNKFSNSAQRIIRTAFITAGQCDYAYVTAPVLFVAITKEAKDLANFVIQKMGVERNTLYQDIASTFQRNESANGSEAQLNAQTDSILEKSCELAQNEGHNFSLSEHILLAFTVVRNDLSGIFENYGISYDGLKAAIEEYRSGQIVRENNELNSSANHENLNKYGRNLTVDAVNGDLEPTIGRDFEIRKVFQILARKTKNNPLLIGEPGIGKTAIIEGLASRIASGNVPDEFKSIQIFSIEVSNIIAGASMQGEFEERLQKIINEAKSDENVVLFIDEIHLLIGAGKTSGAMDAANILKPELARGKIKLIGATTTEEYVQNIEPDKAFARRFHTITINEPTEEDTITILRGIKNRFERHHRVKISDAALISAVRLSMRYISDRFLPDKAIDLVDEAASIMRIDRTSMPEELEQLVQEIRKKEVAKEALLQEAHYSHEDLNSLQNEIVTLREKENALNAKWQTERADLEKIQSLQDQIEELDRKADYEESIGHFATVASIQRQVADLNAEINQRIDDFNRASDNILDFYLDENDIRSVISRKTGIPITTLGEDEMERLRNIETALSREVIGQPEAIHSVASIIKRNRFGFNNPNSPIGSFLFLGTTGVGKTELAKSLAYQLFNSRDMLVRIDMSEYQQEHSVARLFGAPPGYVGYEQGGQLTEAIRRKPYSVVLLDEIEKANHKVYETLLQVLDDGRMTDGKGRVVDFKNTIIIMTSNFGAEEISTHEVYDDELKSRIISGLKHHISPEFVNRLDDILLFNPLKHDDLVKITCKLVNESVQRLKKQDIKLEVEDDVCALILGSVTLQGMGARPIKRAVDSLLLDALADHLLNGSISSESVIRATNDNGTIKFSN